MLQIQFLFNNKIICEAKKMVVVVSTTYFPAAKSAEVGKKYLEVLKKYPPDRTISKQISQKCIIEYEELRFPFKFYRIIIFLIILSFGTRCNDYLEYYWMFLLLFWLIMNEITIR